MPPSPKKDSILEMNKKKEIKMIFLYFYIFTFIYFHFKVYLLNESGKLSKPAKRSKYHDFLHSKENPCI